MFPLAFTAAEWSMIIPVLIGAIVKGIIDLRGDRQRNADIAALKAAKGRHDLQLSRLAPPASHDKHCSSAEQLHRTLRVEKAIHKHHEPPKP